MARLLDLVDQCYGVVLVGDPASPAGVAQGGVCSYSEDAGALAGDELRGRRKERPVEVSCLAQQVEEIASSARLGLVWFRDAAGIDQLDATAVVETAGTADDDVARHARLAHGANQLVGLAVQKMDAADDNVVASQHRGEIIDAIGIAFLGGHPIELRHFVRMTYDCRDVMAAPRELGQNSRSGIARRTDQRNLHYFLPPMNCSGFATSSLASGDAWQSPSKLRSIAVRAWVTVLRIDQIVQYVNYDLLSNLTGMRFGA